MGKGDIRTRRGKVWRGTYGVTRPRRYKTVIRPSATTRKVKTLKDLPKAVAEPIVANQAANADVNENTAEAVEAETSSVDSTGKKPAAKKAAGTKKPAVKKAPAKKD